MGRFQLELIHYFTHPSTVVPTNICVFVSCRPFIVNTTFSTGLVGVESLFFVSWPKPETHNVGWDDGEKNRQNNELILTEIFPSVHET